MAKFLALITALSVATAVARVSPLKSDYASDIMGPLWQTALQKVKGSSDANPSGLMDSWLGAFYMTIFQNTETYSLPKRYIKYIPVWKVANMAIRCNLEYAEGNATADGSSTLIKQKDPFLFTLIREPLSRFVSGFSEISNTLEHDNCLSRVTSRNEYQPIDSPERARLFVMDLLAGALDRSCWVYWHVFSQLGPLRSAITPLDHLGKLEDFAAEWQLVSDKAGYQFPDFNPVCGAHPTSSDEEYPPRENMDNVVAVDFRAELSIFFSDQDLRSALVCSVLLPDYVCFNYPLPDGEDMCVDQGYFASQDEFDQKKADIMEGMCEFLDDPGFNESW